MGGEAMSRFPAARPYLNEILQPGQWDNYQHAAGTGEYSKYFL